MAVSGLVFCTLHGRGLDDAPAPRLLFAGKGGMKPHVNKGGVQCSLLFLLPLLLSPPAQGQACPDDGSSSTFVIGQSSINKEAGRRLAASLAPLSVSDSTWKSPGPVCPALAAPVIRSLQQGLPL